MDAKLEWEIKVDNIDLIKKATEEAVKVALEAVGLQAENYAKRLCPVDTGNLRNSITHDTDVGELCAYVGTNVEYAAYVEYGTQKTKAQPYIKPAVNNHQAEYRDIFQYYLQNA
jgi:HK97 gp10 family phage protein